MSKEDDLNFKGEYILMIELTYAIVICFIGMGATYWMGRYSEQKDMEL